MLAGLLCYPSAYMAVNARRSHRSGWGENGDISNMVLQKDSEISMEGANKQQWGFKGNGIKITLINRIKKISWNSLGTHWVKKDLKACLTGHIKGKRDEEDSELRTWRALVNGLRSVGRES